MPSQGPNSPGTVVSSGAGAPGTIAWVLAPLAAAADAASAMAMLSTGTDTLSEYLKATDFGFSVPADATVNGVVVEVLKTDDGSQILDAPGGVRLVKGGTVSGDDKADTMTEWAAGYATYGGAADLWGLTLTPADVNASTFGFVIAAEYGGASGSNAYVDHVRITVYYTEATSGVTGDLSKTLGALTASAAGAVAVAGAVAKTLGAVTLAAAGVRGGASPPPVVPSVPAIPGIGYAGY